MSDIESGELWSITRPKINKAIKWASAPIGEVVESGLYSARHYANASGLSATAAAASASAASGSASTATTKASEASASATAAAVSETNAANSATASLKKADNLSDLQNRATARANLLASSSMQGLDSAHASTCFLGANNNWNRAVGATEPTNTAYWSASETVNGVTFTRVSFDVDPVTGNTRVTYDAVGTLTATVASFGYVSAASLTDGLNSENWTVSAFIAVTGPSGGVGGAAQVGTGIRVFQFQNTASSVFGGPVSGARTLSTIARVLGSSNAVRCGVQLVGTVGATINARIVIEGLQFEKAAARTAGQYLEMSRTNALAALGLPEVGLQVGFIRTAVTTALTLSAVIPLDNTVPQITEGTQVAALAAYTPKKIGNLIEIHVTIGAVDGASNDFIVAAMFLNGGANAVNSAVNSLSAGGIPNTMSFRYITTVASLSPMTFTLRMGPGTASTIYVNNARGTTTLFGGTTNLDITLREIAQ